MPKKRRLKPQPQSKLLVDTNAYLRLARDIHPLLGAPFCPESHCAYILPECKKELSGHKLQTKFFWVTQTDYLDNRIHLLNIVKAQREPIENTFRHMWGLVQTDWYSGHPEWEHKPRPSKVDTRYVATAEVLALPIITDDVPMTVLADEYGVTTINSVGLFRKMVACDHIALEKVHAIREYLRHERDWPFSPLERDYQRLFFDSGYSIAE